MASGERLDIRASSAQCSSDAAAMTDFKEQPDTPGPQPRQGAKAFEVPVMENTEFSSKLPGFSSPVLASVVEEGSSLLPEADALSEAGAALAAGCQQTAQESGAQQQRKGADIFRCHKKNLRNWCPGKPPEQSGIYTLSIRSAHGVVNRSAQDEFQADLCRIYKNAA